MGSGDREVVCCALGGGWEGGGPASRAPPLPPGRYHHLSSIIGDNRKYPVPNYGRLRQGLPLPHFHQTTQAQPNQSLRTSQGTKELKGVCLWQFREAMLLPFWELPVWWPDYFCFSSVFLLLFFFVIIIIIFFGLYCVHLITCIIFLLFLYFYYYTLVYPTLSCIIIYLYIYIYFFFQNNFFTHKPCPLGLFPACI